MKIYSFFKQGFNLVPLEVEVSLLAGLPQLHLLGRVDPILRESQLRVKSALKNCGFKWPTAKQIIVDLKPALLPKSSEGLDLAIALAYLHASKQIDLSRFAQRVQGQDAVYIYGVLCLNGEVRAPSDLEILSEFTTPIVTGAGELKHSFRGWRLHKLDEIFVAEEKLISCEVNVVETVTPDFFLSQQQARLMSTVATGEHSLLLAGPAGSGKSTFAAQLPFVLGNLKESERSELRRWSRVFGETTEERPVVQPHHSIPNISMIGGGVPLCPGEITRAHGGVLILDEFLEFTKELKESLREPIERGEISVSRRGQSAKFPARFQLIATTNLCICGEMVPGVISGCRYSLYKCRAYLEKLSGPLADRFAALSFTNEWKRGNDMSLLEIKAQVIRAQKFARQTRKQQCLNSLLEIQDLENDLSREAKLLMPEVRGSQRRYKSVLQMARSLADLAEQKEISNQNIEESLSLSFKPFKQLGQIFN